MANSVIVKKIKNRSRVGSEWLELQHCFHPLNNTWEIQLIFYPNRTIFNDYKLDRFGMQEKVKNTMTFILSSKDTKHLAILCCSFKQGNNSLDFSISA